MSSKGILNQPKQLAFASLVQLLLILTVTTPASCVNILFYHHIASYSHRVQTYPYAYALAEQGHNVTFISPFYPRDNIKMHPNIVEIVPPAVAKTMDDFFNEGFNVERRVKHDIPRSMYGYYEPALQACQDLLVSSELQEYLQTTKQLDLVIVDNTMAECVFGIVYKYKTKHMFFHTVSLMGNEYDSYGFLPESSSVPELDVFSPQTPMTFLEKVDNTLSSIRMRYEQHKYLLKLDKMVREHMNLPDMPYLDDLARNVSVVLYTGDVITDYPRTLPPNLVNVVGLHCKNGTNKLPDDIAKFLYSNSLEYEGFVYISLGSLVKPATFPPWMKHAFFETIQSFPKLKFVWKWNGDLPTNIPRNLFVKQWMPQNELLGHPKVKAFVTQSGRPSTIEGLCHTVPMIAFPVLSDQDVISKRLNLLGGNVVLELGTVTKEQFIAAINAAVYDNRIQKRLQELKRILHDRPMPALETALWWTDYVLRHDDFSHLRPAGFHQTWYQRRLLDVWVFLFSISLICIFVTVWLLSYTLKSIGFYMLRRIGPNKVKTK